MKKRDNFFTALWWVPTPSADAQKIKLPPNEAKSINFLIAHHFFHTQIHSIFIYYNIYQYICQVQRGKGGGDKPGHLGFRVCGLGYGV